jgi:DNA-binding transcriptional LysR family regulator
MNYSISQLKIYLKIIQTNSITKTADELHLTQPAVSIQFKNFQEQFEIPLLEIINKKIYVTDFGKVIAASAEKILSEIDNLNDKVNSYQGLLTGKLKVSSVSTGKYVAPFFISDFVKQNPGIELSLDVTNKSQVIASLENNEVDFALVSVLPDNISIEKVELMKNKLFLVGSYEDNSISKKQGKEILEKIPIIFREKGSGTRSVMEKFLLENNLNVSKKFELTSNEAVKQAVIAGLGYSIMPLIGLKNELKNQQLKIIPVDGLPLISTWHLIWLKGKKFLPVADQFLQFVKTHNSEIIKEKFNWIEKY